MSKKKRSGVAFTKADWPLYECWITEDWQEPGQIVQVLVARRAGSDRVAFALFLVDLGCLGVKNADSGVIDSVMEYEDTVRSLMMEMQSMVPCSLDLAAKVVHEGIRYARELGFQPHRDARKALKLLKGASPEEVLEVVPLGDGSGRPLFVAGPYDNVDAVLAKLDRVVGEDGYAFVHPVELEDEEAWEFE